MEDIPHDKGPLLDSTKAQIAAIHEPTMAKLMSDAGIDHASVRQAVMRTMDVKEHPEILQVDHPRFGGEMSGSWYHWNGIFSRDLESEYGD